MEYDLSGIAVVAGVVWLIASAAVGVTASNRGNTGFAWFIVALFVSPLIAVLLLIASPIGAGDRVACERCAERILFAAKVCPFCGMERKQETSSPVVAQSEKPVYPPIR